MVRAMEVGCPMPNGSANDADFCEKAINLSKPWFTIINAPAPKRKSKVAIVNAESEVRVLNSFFMYCDFLEAQCYARIPFFEKINAVTIFC
jgi:hypothetical protein